VIHIVGDVMRARNGRDRRAKRLRYFLRDLAGFANVERLLSAGIIGDRRSPDVVDDDIDERNDETRSLRSGC
jgi:hypothetical protein